MDDCKRFWGAWSAELLLRCLGWERCEGQGGLESPRSSLAPQGLPDTCKNPDSIRVIPAKLIQDPSVTKTDPGTSYSLITLARASSELGHYVFGKKVLSVSTQQFAQRQALDAIWCAMQVCGENNTFKLPEMVLATGSALEIDGIIQENDKTLAQELGKLVYASYKVLGFPVDQWKAEADAKKGAGL